MFMKKDAKCLKLVKNVRLTNKVVKELKDNNIEYSIIRCHMSSWKRGVGYSLELLNGFQNRDGFDFEKDDYEIDVNDVDYVDFERYYACKPCIKNERIISFC